MALSREEQKKLNEELLDACRLARGTLRKIERLLADGADPNARYETGYESSVLHWAAIKKTEAIPMLIAAGADIDVRDSVQGFTPLMLAVDKKIWTARSCL